MAVAAKSLVQAADGFDLCHNEHPWPGVQLDSSLLLSWAPLVSKLRIDTQGFHIAGCDAFVEAAGSQLTYVSLECSNVLAASQANRLLSSCSKDVAVVASGSHLPQMFPCTTHSLNVTFTINENASPYGWNDPLLPDALLHSIARLPFLKELTLDLVGTPDVQLTSHVALPALSVSLRLAVEHDTVMDLSWAQQQPCTELSVEIFIETGFPAQHQLAVSQLLPLPLHSLTVHLRCEFPVNLQVMWQRTRPRTSFTLDMSGCGPAGCVLQVLPKCPRLKVSLWVTDMLLNWAAITSQAAQISLRSYQGQIHIPGAPPGGFGAPTHLEGAWQLTVRSITRVPGLQGACAQGHFLQNAAARLAGWTFDSAVDM